MGVCSSHDDVSLDAGIGGLEGDTQHIHTAGIYLVPSAYLSYHVSVGESDDEAVFGRVVLVFVLGNKALAGMVVRLSLSPSLKLHLVAFEVRSVLHYFDKRLQ